MTFTRQVIYSSKTGVAPLVLACAFLLLASTTSDTHGAQTTNFTQEIIAGSVEETWCHQFGGSAQSNSTERNDGMMGIVIAEVQAKIDAKEFWRYAQCYVGMLDGEGYYYWYPYADGAIAYQGQPTPWWQYYSTGIYAIYDLPPFTGPLPERVLRFQG